MSKKDDFTEEQYALANFAKALGHPARVAILEYLMQSNACFCGNIVDELPLAQSTVSQHLKVLKEASLIQGTIEGNAVCYCIDEAGFAAMQAKINALTKKLEWSKL